VKGASGRATYNYNMRVGQRGRRENLIFDCNSAETRLVE